MIGAIIGDIAGSRFEWDNCKSKEFEFYEDRCHFTDDTVMTIAVAEALRECDGDWTKLSGEARRQMQKWGRKYPDAGYGPMFRKWLKGDGLPYDSYGNGAAMRVSPCGFIGKTEDEVKCLARAVTEVSHDHPEGLKGAEAVALAVFWARIGESKDYIRDRINRDYYPLNFTLDKIRPAYTFKASCQGSVPQAIVAFLEGESFEDCIRNAVSIGGDSDTIAAIAGSIADAFYDAPIQLYVEMDKYLDNALSNAVGTWNRYRAEKLFELLSSGGVK